MLSADARGRLCLVLVGARNPQNIGAAARAMQDFGFSHLRVVNPFTPPFEAAQMEASSAVGGAAEVMRGAQQFDSLAEAIADCGLVVGTTAVGERALAQPVQALQMAAEQIRAALRGGGTPEQEVLKVALLFGSEKTGLTREQLSFCSTLVTIPLWKPEDRHLSMNLGQAVAVCLYELSRSGFEGARVLPERLLRPASAADRERLLSLVGEAMTRSEYARRFPANARPEVVRGLVQSLAVSAEVAATWMGFFKMALRAMPADEAAGEGDVDRER